MNDQSTGDTELVEALAALEHRQWRHWTQSLAEREDLPDHLVERWEENWVPYDELDDETKDHDRAWAKSVVELLNEHEIVAEAETGGRDSGDGRWPYCPNCGAELTDPAGPYHEWTDCPQCGEVCVEFYQSQGADVDVSEEEDGDQS